MINDSSRSFHLHPFERRSVDVVNILRWKSVTQGISKAALYLVVTHCWNDMNVLNTALKV